MFLVISGDLGFGGDNPHKSFKNILLPNKALQVCKYRLSQLDLVSKAFDRNYWSKLNAKNHL
jgi:hypothetical protein